MQVLRKVKVITKITEEYKKIFSQDMEHAIEDLKKVIVSLDKEIKKLSKPQNQSEMIKYNSLLGYREQQVANLENLQQKKARVLAMKDGEELLEATLDSVVEIKKGDNIYQKLKEAYIKVEDGKVVEIKE